MIDCRDVCGVSKEALEVGPAYPWSEWFNITAYAFFPLAKLIWTLICPETLVVVSVGWALFQVRKGRYNAARRLLNLTFMAMLATAFMPIGNLLLAPLENRFPTNPKLSDVHEIIILGGAVDAGQSHYWGQPSINDAAERLVEALTLARRFPEAKVLLSGGNASLSGDGPSESQETRKILISAGLAPQRLITEDKSRTTAENAELSRHKSSKVDKGQAVLVTSAFHMPRAMGSFCAVGWKNIVAWPTDYRSSPFSRGFGWNFIGNLENLSLGLKEWVGLLGYYATGRTRELFPHQCSS